MIIRTQGNQKEAQVVDLTNYSPNVNPILHYTVEYDSTKPEETIRNFVSDIRKMVAKYAWNRDRIKEIENEMSDIEHYMEIANYKPIAPGYRLYRKLAELRRERRACKNEVDLLQPIYEYFHATEVLNRLSTVQGECAKAKSTIDNRCYVVRTDVLNEWLNPPEKPADEDQANILDMDLKTELSLDSQTV